MITEHLVPFARCSIWWIVSRNGCSDTSADENFIDSEIRNKLQKSKQF